MSMSAARPVTIPAGEPDAVQGRHVVCALVVDRPGTLSRVAGLLRARSFNIESLTVGATHEPGRSWMTIVLRGDEGHLRQVLSQLQRLIDVLEVTDIAHGPHLELELAIVELDAPRDTEAETALRAAITDGGGEPISTDAATWRARLTARPNQLDRTLDTLRGLGLRRLVRAGAVAMTTPTPDGATPS
jgi:acetolactate synthase I/III small subunit